MKMLLFLVTSILALNSIAFADVSLTVYNNDLAIVKSVEEMSFIKGLQAISLTDVASRIDPTSVRFTSSDGNVTVLEQNYRYDIVNTAKVLHYYIDKQVSIWVKDGDLIEGVLQSVTGDVIVKGRDGRLNILKEDVIERFDLPELPEGLVTRPTLIWQVNSLKSGDFPTEVSYMTGGLSWHAEYSAVVSEDEENLEISSWVSINNMSGATYENAALKLVAGDVNMLKKGRPLMKREAVLSLAAEDEMTGGFEERGLFEYHLYDLGRATTIANAEIKQIALVDPTDVITQKKFMYEPWKDPKKVAVSMEFINSEEMGLGMALPAGKIRVYKRDTDGSIEFIGEDAVDHTPRNEKVRMVLGSAFDIVAEKKIIETRRISQRIREQDIEISLRNRKEEQVVITVSERFYGDWEILKKSHDFIKKDAYTAEFSILVPADAEVIAAYTIRYK
ncbi:hypothetical protein ES708_06592 [subsurface metagenome]